MLARFLFFVHFTFFGSILFLFLFYSSLFFFWCTFIYLFYISNTTSAVYMFHLRSLILMYCVHAFAGFYVSAWVRCICACVCVSCIASTDVNFNLSLYINPSIHRTAYTSQRLPLFTLLFNFCIALTLKGWTECDGESVTMRYR